MTLSFYQNGIMRCLIEESDSTRFRISEYDLPVVEEQLIPVTDLSSHITNDTNWLYVENLSNDNDGETYAYNITYSPFVITQYANGMETLVINKNHSLAYEINKPPVAENDWPT